MHASRVVPRHALAPLLVGALLALHACGGGGSDPSTGGGPSAALDASGGSTGGALPPGGSGTPSGGGTTAPPGGDGGNASSGGSGSHPPVAGGDPPNAIRGTEQSETLQGTPGDDVMLAGGGDDRLEGGAGNDRMIGGGGNDTYVVTEAGDAVVEAEGEGTDVILTSVSYQLPVNVENLRALEPSSARVLTGNALANHIVGSPFVHEEIHGLDGDDILDGGGRHGGFLDGGNGNDRLLVSFGELRGGAGADTFVAAGPGAQTSPETPITGAGLQRGRGGPHRDLQLAGPLVGRPVRPGHPALRCRDQHPGPGFRSVHDRPHQRRSSDHPHRGP